MPFPSVSKRLLQIPASPIRKLVPYGLAAKKKGVKVYYFNIGDPDIDTPDVMLSVLRNWNKKTITYSRSQGEPVLLEGLQKYYHKLGYSFIDVQDLQVTVGGSEAISMVFLATTSVEDGNASMKLVANSCFNLPKYRNIVWQKFAIATNELIADNQWRFIQQE